jgi:hypothetical protein
VLALSTSEVAYAIRALSVTAALMKQTMTSSTDRTHTASRHIKSAAQAIYDAFLNREAVSKWLLPQGATGDIDVFEPRAGGRFRITLTFESAAGKSSKIPTSSTGDSSISSPESALSRRLNLSRMIRLLRAR